MNKMFKKLMAVSATVAIAATMSVSAFAETKANHDNGTVSVSGYEAVDNAVQYTVMVFKVADDTTDFAAVNPADYTAIYYINQGTELYDEVDKDGLLDKMLVKATDGENALPEGTYVVRIGNDQGVPTSLGLSVEEEATILYGDANKDGNVNARDVVFIKRYVLGTDGYDATTVDLAASDVNADGSVNARDVVVVKRHVLGTDGYEVLPKK